MQSRTLLKWLSVLVSLLCAAFIWVACIQQDWGFNNLLWGDHIRLNYLPYNILYQHYSLWGWQLRPVPGFFPNLLYELLAYLIFKDFIPANLLIGAFELLGVWICFGVLLKSLRPERGWSFHLCISAWMLSFCGCLALYSNFYHTLIGAYHVGNLMATLLLLAAFIRYLSTGQRWWLWLIPGLIFLSVISDRTILLTAVVPIVVLMLVQLIRKQAKLSRIRGSLWIVLGVVFPVTVGMSIYLLPPFIRGDRYLLVMQKGPSPNFQLIKAIFTFEQGWLGPILSLLLILVIGWLVQELLEKRLKLSEKYCFALLSIGALCNVVSLVYLSPLPIFATWYLLTPLFLIPGFAVYRLYSRMASTKRFVIFLFGSLVALTGVSAAQYDPEQFQMNLDRIAYVSGISCLNGIEARGIPLQSGLAAYDQAPLIRLMSHGRFPVFSARPDYLQLWVNNMYWYIKPDNTDALRQYNFIVISQDLKLFNQTKIRRIFSAFSQPDHIATCPNGDVVALYTSPKKHRALNQSIYRQLLCEGETPGLRFFDHNIKWALSGFPLLDYVEHYASQNEIIHAVRQYERCDRNRAYLKQFPKAWSQAESLLKQDAVQAPTARVHESSQKGDLGEPSAQQ